jgi:bacterioferritin-associated ferredoxin
VTGSELRLPLDEPAADRVPVSAEVDDPVICVCRGITENEICAVIAAGARTLPQVRVACGANTGCGSCADDIEELIEDGAP